MSPAPIAHAVSSTESRDGTVLAVRTVGDPGARPLVLVHGWAQSSAAWGGRLLDELAERFFVVVPDLRGHGHSGVPETGYDDPATWSEDLAAVLGAAGVGVVAGAGGAGSAGAGAGPGAGGDGTSPGVILLGWSYGGIVVVDHLAHAGTAGVAGVVLCGAVTSLSRSAAGRVGPAMREVVTGGGLDDDPRAAAEAFGTFGEALLRGGDDADRQRLTGLALATPPAVRRALLDRRVDHDDTLRGLDVPVLVVHGAEDTVVPPATGRAAADLAPEARVVELPGCAHAPFLEDRAGFVAALEEFAAGL